LAHAATGDLVGTANFSQQCFGGLGVGLTFDGANLWYSCARSTPDLFRADPHTGQVTASYTIANGLGALAYDAVHNRIFAGWATGQGQVYQVDLDAGHSVTHSSASFAAPAAVVCGLLDGMAYDGSNDTLYVSDDCSTTVYHYAPAPSGTLLESFAWAGTSCYNSGLALGNQLLFEGSDGCNKVVVVDKSAPQIVKFQFSTQVAGDPNFRDEGLTCDTVSFPGTQVMWSKEAYSPNRAHAFAIPAGSCGVGGQPAVTHRPLIFVPGIAGSELEASRDGKPTVTGSHGQSVTISYHAGDIIWLNGAWLNPVANENFDILRFDNTGLPIVGDFSPAHRSSPELGSVVQILGQAYAGVEDFFKSKGYTPGQDFFFGTYDWRYSAENALPDLGFAVAEALRRNPGADGVDIIAHSMGTLVTRHFLLNSPLSAKVKHAVFLSGPHLGTPKGTWAAVYGVGLPEFPPGGMQPAVLKYLFDTLPGGIDQAIQQSYYNVYHGQDVKHPVPVIDLRGTRHPYTYAEVRNYELNAGVTPVAFATAESFHASDLGWGGQLAGRNIAVFSGVSKCTIGQIQFRQQATRAGMRTYIDYADVNGDGTVVEGVSSMNEGRLVPFSVYYRKADHAQMGQSSDVLKDALAVVQDKTVNKGSPTDPGFFSFCHGISVHSPMEVLVTDAQGRRLGGFDPTTDLKEMPDGTFDRFNDMKLATVVSPGPYTVALRGTGSGESSIKVRDWGDGVANRTVLFTHLPTTPATKGSFTMDATGSPGQLSLDVNGDGTDVRTFNPVVLTGAAANDTTPPDIHIDLPLPNQAFVGTARIAWTASDLESGVAFSRAVVDAGTANEQTLTDPGPVTLGRGVHSLIVLAEDRAENAAQVSAQINVFAYEWLPPLSAGGQYKSGRTIPVKFSVSNLAGQPVDDSSARIEIVDGSGATLVGPIGRAQNPATGLVFQDGQYHADVRTDGLVAGDYRIRVSFSSPDLAGQFELGVTIV
jgi:pimeloyl-ACP methyl ester carboxylesterase